MSPSSFRRVAVLAALSLPFLLLNAGTAAADSGSRQFEWFAGDGPVCAVAPDACPAVAEAPNGWTLEISGSGTFGIHPKSVAGGGEFTLKDSAGNVVEEGTFEAIRLLGFHSYGCGGEGLPDNFCGGLLIMDTAAFVGGDQVGSGVLQVDCEIGKVPSGHHEGVRVNIRGLNFNHKAGGLTVFIEQ